LKSNRQSTKQSVSLILAEMWNLGLYVNNEESTAESVLKKKRELEANGYRFEDAEASLHLLILESLGYVIKPFEVVSWEIKSSRTLSDRSEVSGTIVVRIFDSSGSSREVGATKKGVGPIHAVDLALKECLENDFPELKNLRLSSYSLNIVDSRNGTAAAARARTEFTQYKFQGVQSAYISNETWATTAVSDDVLDASIKSLIDGYRYKLIFRNERSRFAVPDWKIAISGRYSSERC